MSGSSYTNVFGGSAIAPINPSYLAFTITTNTTLVWPLESGETTPYVADLCDVTAASGGLNLAMPPGNTGSTGVAGIFTNVGAQSFTLTDQGGNSICILAPSQQWIVALTSNSTTNGTWRAYQLAATTSSAQASSLAGYGLQASGSQLQTNIPTRSPISLTVNIGASDRGSLIYAQEEASSTFVLDDPVNLGTGWYCYFQTDYLTPVLLRCSSGATVNGVAQLNIPVGQGGIIVCQSGNFSVFGGITSTVPITAGGTGATTAGAALSNLGGTSVGVSIFTAPSPASVVALLGLNNFTFQESSVGTNQTLAAGSSNTIFIATAAISVGVPLTTTLTKQFIFGILAQGGAVTVTPQASDKINNATAGANYVLAQGSSALFVTDANGNIWPVFLSRSQSGAWVAAGGTSDAITATYSPANITLIDGVLLGFRATAANTTTTPTFAPDGLTARTITNLGGFALQPGAIPGANAECIVRYNLANTRWELLNPANGNLLNVQVFGTPGTSTYTSTAGTRSVVVETWGGGGGSGGCANTGVGQVSLSGGGGGGGYAKARITSGFSGLTVTVGAAGTAGTTVTSGGNGGASSLGTLISAGGGNGSSNGSSVGVPGVGPGGGAGSASVPANAGVTSLVASYGTPGGFGLVTTVGGAAFGGLGGASGNGGGSGLYAGPSGAGNAGVAPGGGGGGSCQSSASSSGFAGALGGAGLVIIWEYS